MRLLSCWLKCRPTCSTVYEIAGGEKREYATTLSESIHVLASLSQQMGLLSSDTILRDYALALSPNLVWRSSGRCICVCEDSLAEVRRRVFVPDVGQPV